jgi:20S proteasome alpha/beta subunit
LICYSQNLFPPGAIQEVPYAAHGEGFSFVLGLLDRSNRQKQRVPSDALPELEDLPVGTSNMIPTPIETTDKHGSQLNINSNGIECSSDQMLIKPQNKRKGSLLLMTVDEGVTVIRSCMDAARKRTLGSLGSCRIKGVTGRGCIDLGAA